MKQGRVLDCIEPVCVRTDMRQRNKRTGWESAPFVVRFSVRSRERLFDCLKTRVAEEGNPAEPHEGRRRGEAVARVASLVGQLFRDGLETELQRWELGDDRW